MDENKKFEVYSLVVEAQKITNSIEHLKMQRELLLKQIIKIQSDSDPVHNKIPSHVH